MSILSPTNCNATAVWLGVNTDSSDLTTSAVSRIEVGYEGFKGDTHSGLTRASCVRVKQQYEVGTQIRNTRQISALCENELAKIAELMEIDSIKPEWVGANLIVSGIHQFTKVPPASRILFEGGVSLVVDMENGPCRYPGDIIRQHHPDKGARFAKAAQGMRGITMWVEKPGVIEQGESAQLHIPPPVIWQP